MITSPSFQDTSSCTGNRWDSTATSTLSSEITCRPAEPGSYDAIRPRHERARYRVDLREHAASQRTRRTGERDASRPPGQRITPPADRLDRGGECLPPGIPTRLEPAIPKAGQFGR